jgi:hypothetical protein
VTVVLGSLVGAALLALMKRFDVQSGIQVCMRRHKDERTKG